MADNVTFQSATPSTPPDNTKIATDDAGAGGHVQIVKLAQSADGSATAIPADTDGMLVNLGTNNDVTVTGTVTANIAAGTNNIGDVDVLSIAAGDNNIGNVDIASIAAGDNNIGNVDVLSSALPTGASTLAEQQTQTTALQLVDDIVYTDDTSTHSTGSSKGALIMAAAAPTDASVNANDIGAVAMTTDRKLHVSVQDSLPAGTAAIGKLAANSGVDIGDVDITSIAAGDNNIGNVDIVSLPALAAGTNAIGKLLPPDVDVTTHTNYAKKYYTNAGAVTDGIVWSPASGKRWHVVSMFINTSAAATVTFEDDKAGGDEAVMKMELAANSGMTINYGEKYPLASGEDAADLLVTTSAGNIYVTVTGYEI